MSTFVKFYQLLCEKKLIASLYTDSELVKIAKDVGTKLYGKSHSGLIIDPTVHHIKYSNYIKDTEHNGDEPWIIDTYSYIFFPSTGKGLDDSDEPFSEKHVDVDGNIYIAGASGIYILENPTKFKKLKEDSEDNSRQYEKLPTIQETIDKFLQRKDITKNSDGSYDVDGSVDISGFDGSPTESLKRLPLNFRKVTGNFQCRYNNLTTLKGAPIEVGRDFGCDVNNLTSLEHAPKKVGRNFWCGHNKKQFTENDVRNVTKVEGRINV